MEKEHIIYRYIFDGETIYVGKTDSSLKQRIESHAREDKFQPYLEKAQIEYFNLNNSAETTFWETYLINKFHGKLNVTNNYNSTELPDVQIPKWNSYKDYCFERKKAVVNKPKKQMVEIPTFYCGDLGEIPFSNGKTYIAKICNVKTPMHKWLLYYVLLQYLKHNFISHSDKFGGIKIKHNICVLLDKKQIELICDRFCYSCGEDVFHAISPFGVEFHNIYDRKAAFIFITDGSSYDGNKIYIYIYEDLLKKVREMTQCSFLDMAYRFLRNEAGIKTKGDCITL